jgi:hypothetical protein
MPCIAVFKAEGTNIVPTGHRTYPRYFKLEFAFHRAKYVAQLRPIDSEKMELQTKVVELRLKGWSFPAIARYLDISVGTVWNMTHVNIPEHCDNLDSLE